MTRRLLLVAAAVAVLGLMATPALEETAAGGWFNVPWDGSGLVSRVVDSLMLLGSSRSSDQQVHYHEYEANQ